MAKKLVSTREQLMVIGAAQAKANETGLTDPSAAVAIFSNNNPELNAMFEPSDWEAVEKFTAKLFKVEFKPVKVEKVVAKAEKVAPEKVAPAKGIGKTSSKKATVTVKATPMAKANREAAAAAAERMKAKGAGLPDMSK